MGYSVSRQAFHRAMSPLAWIAALTLSVPVVADEAAVFDVTSGGRAVLSDHQVAVPPTVDDERVIVLCKDKASAIDRYQRKIKARGGVAQARDAQEAMNETGEALSSIRTQLGITNDGAALRAGPDQDIRKRDVIELRSTLCGLGIRGLSRDEHRQLTTQGYEIVPDRKVTAFLNQSVAYMKADAQSLSALGGTWTGANMRIGIVDTGIDYRHADLGGCFGSSCRVRGGYDYVNGDNDPLDDQGHGTHVAGIAAGSGALLKGVAPQALLYGYKVLDANGSGWTSTIAWALDDAVDPNRDGNTSDRQVDVLNLSLGGVGDPDDVLSQAVDRAVAGGIVVVVAAGNSGPWPGSIGSPGAARRAITVGASNKVATGTPEEGIATFSSRGPVVWNNQSISKPDIVAPGMSICAARPFVGPFSTLSACAGSSSHVALSGTSMATPHVAGLAALIRQKNPNWTPDQIKAVLISTASKVFGGPTVQGNGLVQGVSALSQTAAPPVIYLEPLSYAPNGINGALPVKARILSTGLQSYTIDSTLLDSFTGTGSNAAWTTRVSVSSPQSGDFQLQTTLNLLNFTDGEHVLRLTATSIGGLSATVYGAIRLKRINLASPLMDDFVRVGSVINAGASVLTSGGSVPTFSYRRAGATAWQPLIGTQWQTSGLPTGAYEFKAEQVLPSKSTPVLISDQVSLRLDSQLRTGFPVRMDLDNWAASGVSYASAGRLDPLVLDLNGDGTQEIVLHKAGNPPKLFAFKHDGTSLWSVPIGNKRQGWDVGPIVAGNQKNGLPVLYVFSSGGDDRWEGGHPYSEIYALNGATGTVLSGWPIRIPKRYDTSLVTGRVLPAMSPNDHQLIVADPWLATYSSDPKVLIFDSSGVLVREWALPQLGCCGLMTNPHTQAGPILANLDSDPEMEIVYTRGETKTSSNVRTYDTYLEARNADGTSVSGWPVSLPSLMMGPPVSADLDADGTMEIVAQTWNFQGSKGALTVIGSNGQHKQGWPKLEYNGTWHSPAVGDFDRDGKREIVSCSFNYWGSSCGIYSATGTLLPGWPKDLKGNHLRSPVIGDVDGDRYPDLVINTHADQAEDNGRNYGRIYAFNRQGNPLAVPAWHSMKSLAAPVIADLDGNRTTELVAIATGDDNATRRLGVYVWNLAASFGADWTEWPMFGSTAARDGRYIPPIPAFSYPRNPLSYLVNQKINASPLFPGLPPADSWTLAGAALPPDISFIGTTGQFIGFSTRPVSRSKIMITAKNPRGTRSLSLPFSINSCVGQCVGVRTSRSGTECLTLVQATSLSYLKSAAAATGSTCPATTPNIVGFEYFTESSGCYRTDSMYCK